jgi:hypothetical protein
MSRLGTPFFRAADLKALKSNLAGVPLGHISAGKRHRKDYGDIADLAQSIEAVGLLHPVVIRPDGRLIAGARRLRAFRCLKRETIPAIVVDLEKVVLGEYAENTFRKAYTPSESVDIARAFEPIERAKAKERQREHGKTAPGRKHSGQVAPSVGRATDKVAKATGLARRTLEKAKAVVEAAEVEPERFSDLKEQMDDSGKVDRAFKELNIRKGRQAFEARRDAGAGRGCSGQEICGHLHRSPMVVQGLFGQGWARGSSAVLSAIGAARRGRDVDGRSAADRPGTHVARAADCARPGERHAPVARFLAR